MHFVFRTKKRDLFETMNKMGNEGRQMKWTFQTGNNVNSSPAIGVDGIIYVGSDDAKLYAVNPDGTEMVPRNGLLRQAQVF